jgi:hypothetical protein
LGQAAPNLNTPIKRYLLKQPVNDQRNPNRNTPFISCLGQEADRPFKRAHCSRMGSSYRVEIVFKKLETGTGKRQSKPAWGYCFGGTRTQYSCGNGLKIKANTFSNNLPRLEAAGLPDFYFNKPAWQKSPEKRQLYNEYFGIEEDI